MIFKILGRIIVVGFGLFLSVLFGFLILTYLGSTLVSEDLAGRYGSETQVSDFETTVLTFLGAVSFVFTLYPALTILPALLIAAIGEIGHIRSILFYIIAGGLGALSIPLLYVVMSPDANDMPSQHFLAIFATSGFGAGLLYWLIAGRRA
jgi:hypothetical protein